jgi:hypothetical protein
MDLTDWVIPCRERTPRTKSQKPSLAGNLKEIIVRRLAKRLPDCPFYFTAAASRLSHLQRHQKRLRKPRLKVLRRRYAWQCVRNLRRAGNDEHDCMEISGHKTRAIFDRYDIIDEDDQRRTLERQQIEQGRKVIPIRQAG